MYINTIKRARGLVMNIRLNLRSVPYQPFLVIVFLGISIYSPNRLYFPIDVMMLPMCILIGLIGISLSIIKYMHSDLNKGQIFISCALLLNFNYYLVCESLTLSRLNFALGDIIYLVLCPLLILIIWKSTYPQIDHLSQILGVITISLVLISLFNLGFIVASDIEKVSSVNQSQEFEVQYKKYVSENLVTDLNERDFYFIIIDRYPGEDILYSEFGYNNEDFIRNLTNLGFSVLKQSRSNYGITDRSIPSMVNMDYLELVYNAGYDLENNRLWRFFKSQGFKFVYLPSDYSSTVNNEYADIVLNPFPISLGKELDYRTFQKIMFFERTLVGKVYYFMLHIFFNKEMPDETIKSLQDRIRMGENISYNEFETQRNPSPYRLTHPVYTFDNLTKVYKIPGKKFILAHINDWEIIKTDNETYINKIQNANLLVESTIKKIIANSHPAPVIILLSDHGRKPSIESINKNRSIYAKYACYKDGPLEQDYIDGSFYPLNNLEAFYLPDGGNENIYPGISPVNIWRIVLNYYFKTAFPLTRDKSIWYSRDDGFCEIC